MEPASKPDLLLSARIPLHLGSKSLHPWVLGNAEHSLLSKWLAVKALSSVSDVLLPGLLKNTWVFKKWASWKHAHIRWKSALTIPYLLKSLQERGMNNFVVSLPLNTEKSNFKKGGRGAGYASISWTLCMCMSSDAAMCVLHRSSRKTWSRKGRCSVQWWWSKHLSSSYILSIWKVRGRQRSMGDDTHGRSLRKAQDWEGKRGKSKEVREKRVFKKWTRY